MHQFYCATWHDQVSSISRFSQNVRTPAWNQISLSVLNSNALCCFSRLAVCRQQFLRGKQAAWRAFTFLCNPLLPWYFRRWKKSGWNSSWHFWRSKTIAATKTQCTASAATQTTSHAGSVMLLPKVAIAPRIHLQELTPEKRAFYSNFVCESVNELCILTAGQSSCPRWHKERKVRISSTAAYTILRTRRGLWCV